MTEPRDNSLVLWGIHHVQDIIQTSPSMVEAILVEKAAGHHLSLLLDTLKKAGIPWRETDRRELVRVAGPRARHVVAVMRDYQYRELEDVLPAEGEPGLVLALDGVTDPGNFGSIVRSAAFFGVDAIIIPKNNSCSVNPTVLKRSAGAVCSVEIARVTNLVRALEQLKEYDFWVYGTTPESGRPLDDEAFAPRTCLVLGAEGKGMRMGVKRHCDLFLTLDGGWESLNVSTFGAVMMYAWSRSRRHAQNFGDGGEGGQ